MNALDPFLDENEDALASRTFSEVATGMAASEILVIAYAVRAQIEAGKEIANFTVGDFAPSEFRVPAALAEGIAQAVAEGHTNYPPAHGTPELRTAICDHYAERLGLDYPVEAVVVASGARPVLYAAFRCLLDAGEKVVTPAPSWNNNNFCQLVGAQHVVVPSRPEDDFMPTAERLAPHLRDARLLVLCSPMNPTGTMIRPQAMADICDLVLAENARRAAAGERALYLVYDQVYRMLTFGDVEHVTPVGLRPEMARYTLFTDAISKCFAATGLRVGWLMGPPFIAARIKALMTHMGAWAPRPEQMATAAFLRDTSAVDAFLHGFRGTIRGRLQLIYDAFTDWKAEGLPVDVIAPEGAIYLSVKIALEGRPGFANEADVRRYLLDEAGCAILPFSVFGDTTNIGWMRFSVGAVSVEQIKACLPRLRAALVSAVS